MSASQMFGSAYPYSYPIYNPITNPQVAPQNNVRTVIPGRSVANPKDITIADIPLDSSMAVFPREDGQAIYVKSRNDMGGVDTKIYIPAPEDYEEPVVTENSDISNADIMKSITDMSTQINDRMNHFILNDILWSVRTVKSDSPYLVDRTNQYRLATTDPNTHCIYLSDSIPQYMTTHVLMHEIGHCVIFSYDFFDELHQMVKPEYWIDIEEWVCNFLANYGLSVYSIAKSLQVVTAELEKLVA